VGRFEGLRAPGELFANQLRQGRVGRGSTTDREGLRELPQFLVELHQEGVGIGRRTGQLDSLLQDLDGFGVLLSLGQKESQRIPIFRIVGLQLGRPAAPNEPFLEASLPRADRGCRRRGRIVDRWRTPCERLLGFGDVPHFREEHAQVQIDHGIGWVEAAGLTQGSFGLIVLAEGIIGEGGVDQWRDAVGQKLARSAKGVDGPANS